MSDITHNKVDVTTPNEIHNGVSEPSASVTDARFGKPEPDAHAEQRMAHIKERNGHVIASVQVPAHTAEVSLGHSAIEGCALAAAEAWDSIEKAPDDADFAHSTGQWRLHLINVAESVYTSGVTTAGETTIAKFERAVQKIKARQDEETKQAAAKAA